MKTIAVIFVCLFLIAACSDELPPSPPSPGKLTGAAIVGRAPSWAAVSHGIKILPSPAKQGQTAVISVNGFGAVHPKAYYYTKKTGAWKEFSLQGNLSGNWIAGPASGLIPITSEFDEGKAYIIVYACQRFTDSWDCNGDHWMLEEFVVSASASAPAQSSPADSSPVNASAIPLPELVPTTEMVVNKTIPPFWILGTLAVPDSLGSVGARRYDAKYRSASGLEVLVYVFDFNNRVELEKGLNEQFAEILKNGLTDSNGKRLALFVDARPHAIAFWTNGKRLVYIDTFAPSANKQIIDKYMELYPSDLPKGT